MSSFHRRKNAMEMPDQPATRRTLNEALDMDLGTAPALALAQRSTDGPNSLPHPMTVDLTAIDVPSVQYLCTFLIDAAFKEFRATLPQPQGVTQRSMETALKATVEGIGRILAKERNRVDELMAGARASLEVLISERLRALETVVDERVRSALVARCAQQLAQHIDASLSRAQPDDLGTTLKGYFEELSGVCAEWQALMIAVGQAEDSIIIVDPFAKERVVVAAQDSGTVMQPLLTRVLVDLELIGKGIPNRLSHVREALSKFRKASRTCIDEAISHGANDAVRLELIGKKQATIQQMETVLQLGDRSLAVLADLRAVAEGWEALGEAGVAAAREAEYLLAHTPGDPVFTTRFLSPSRGRLLG